MGYWSTCELNDDQKNGLLECFADTISETEASLSTGIDNKNVKKFYLKCKQACWISVSGGRQRLNQADLYSVRKDSEETRYLFYRLTREKTVTGDDSGYFIQYSDHANSKVFIRQVVSEDCLETYIRKYKPGRIYLMRPGKYTHVPSDKMVRRSKNYGAEMEHDRHEVYKDQYRYGIVGIEFHEGLNRILTPSVKLRNKNIYKSAWRTNAKDEPPTLKQAHMKIIGTLKNRFEIPLSFEEFSLLAGEQLLRFNRTNYRTGLNKELFNTDIRSILREYDDEHFTDLFPPQNNISTLGKYSSRL